MKPGSTAPEFELADQDGAPWSLRSHLTEGPVVLFFYPAAFTTGCTKEACYFRDITAEFRAAGATIVGISRDDVATQKRFDDEYGLGYPVLSDQDGAVAAAYGLKRRMPGLPAKRVTFVVAPDGRVVEEIASELNMNVHADKALAALAALG
ncbi:peroxiredoxin [Nocardioides hankookensis]|uniref:thioredoxin-dependent peroxiredoxin n=1 Tax=Nocardioides hankookensis TaxID=443157 RepID=A0ABW1LNH8_9ACTN